MTAVHHYLWWAPYSVLQQWAVILHRLLFPLLSLPLSPSWQRKKQEGLQGMATTEEIYLVRHWKRKRQAKRYQCGGGRWMCGAREQHVLTISSAVVAHDGVSGEMVRQHDRRTAQVTTRQLHRQKGGRGKPVFPPWPLGSASIHRSAKDTGT